MPGRGRVSSIRNRPGVASNCWRAAVVAAKRSSQLSPLIRRCTGFPLAGPRDRLRISILMPGISFNCAVSSSMTVSPSNASAFTSREMTYSVKGTVNHASRLFGRSSHGMVSSWICPMVSIGACAPPVFAFNPPLPAKANAVSIPGCAPIMSSACLTNTSFSSRLRLPRAST